MCGIIAVVRRPTDRAIPTVDEVCGPLEQASLLLDELISELAEVRTRGTNGQNSPAAAVALVANLVAGADQLLRGVAGIRLLIEVPGASARIATLISGVAMQITSFEGVLDADTTILGLELEAVNAALIDLKDAAWAVRRDRLRAAEVVVELVGVGANPAAIGVGLSMHQALSALDRLEVRGRDSAGLHLLVTGHGIDLESPALRAELLSRSTDPLFGSMAVRTPAGHLSLVYKAAAEIGELGDNTHALRSAIASDPLLEQALASATVEAVVLGHTRWASVGIISQPNAHPLNSDEVAIASDSAARDGFEAPYLTAVLNGDVDNFADLKISASLRIADEITTDAKVIPTLTSRAMLDGAGVVEAFRETVNQLEGSVAIAASSAAEPSDLLLALRGSGQALYIGLAEDAYIVASEPYGVVEDTPMYLRLDGDVPADPSNPASRGQVVCLRGNVAGSAAGIERWAYDGTALSVSSSELDTAQITTRDIDRGDSPHFLLKEIGEAAGSFRKTLRGKLIDGAHGLEVVLGDAVLSPEMRAGLADGSINRVIAIGQGTAAVAARALVEGLAAFAPRTNLRVTSALATELSGFDLADS
ncbi:MAG: glucosamine-6-phosphate synthase, partial [Actinobacteria bacterium]|nr:glucosamine-6-phosphate synthase [Actinomycetota bacterium]